MRALVIISVLCVATVSLADEPLSEKAIHKGDWGLGASGALSYDSFSGATWSAAMNMQYFFMDKFSLGVTGSVQKDKFTEVVSLGPEATFYFLELQNSIFFLSQNIKYNAEEYDYLSTHERHEYLSAETTLGYNYFLNPHVAVGPRLRYKINEGRPASNIRDSLGLLFGVSVYF